MPPKAFSLALSGRRLIALLLGLIFPFIFGLALVQSAALTQRPVSAPGAGATVGDPLPRIVCGPGYTATIYAEGLSGPDGLAFNPNGELFVAEETSGEVSQIGPGGLVTTVLTGVLSPEGITFDSSGNLYVVEDITNGRVVKRDSSGITSTLVGGLSAPEGIVWVDDGGAGVLYVTESNVEYALSISSTTASDYRTHVTRVSPTGTFTRMLTTTAIITTTIFPSPMVEAQMWSYSGLTVGPDGRLYVANEIGGQDIITTYMGIPFHGFTSASLFTVLTSTLPATRTAFTDNGLIAPEGPRFSEGGGFPLYVAEEDIGNDEGRVSQVLADGTYTPFCSGFFSIEDVLLAPDGNLYVSEDTSGWVIRIQPPPPPLIWWLYLPLVRR